VSEPVATGTWHDQAPEIAEAARGLLRLNGTDPDLDRLAGTALAACSVIDHRLNLRVHPDRPLLTVGGETWNTYAVDDAPPDVVTAAVQLAGELFRRKDAPFGVLNAASANAVPMYISRDVLAGVDSLLAPYVEGWGFA
jgi:hypothetical protein